MAGVNVRAWSGLLSSGILYDSRVKDLVVSFCAHNGKLSPKSKSENGMNVVRCQ
jgi:hypothetical protein